jgi:deoxyribonuclease IV
VEPPAAESAPGPRLGVHLPLGNGLLKAADRAAAIGAETVQVFVDNPTAWRRRAAPPQKLPEFRARLDEVGIRPVAVHAAYLVNLAGPDRAFREASIEILATDMQAAVGYGSTLVNVHTGSHRDTSVEAGIELIADGIARVLDAAGDVAAGVRLALENASGGGHTLGVTIDELAAIADAAAMLEIPAARLGFCLDTAHAWGAGVPIDEPEGVDAWLAEFDRKVGLERLFMIHLNDSRSERGDRQDRHEHVGAGRIGDRGLGHLLRHPSVQGVPFISETPGMDVGYDAVNVARARALARGESLEPLPPEAFEVSSGGHRSAAPD